jgi:hypothetical protein
MFPETLNKAERQALKHTFVPEVPLFILTFITQFLTWLMDGRVAH